MSRLVVLLLVLVVTGGLVAAAVVTRPAGSEVVAPSTSTVADDDPPAASTVALEDHGPYQPLRDIQGWLQTDTDVDDLGDLVDGKVAVVQIWTFGCYNCKNTLPNLRGLRDRFADRDDFQIVGVHSPEFDFEEDPENILAAAAELDVTWPIALDTNKRTFFGWQGNRGFWPRTYVIDRDGTVRFDHIGEGAYTRLNDTVATLLAAGDDATG